MCKFIFSSCKDSYKKLLAHQSQHTKMFLRNNGDYNHKKSTQVNFNKNFTNKFVYSFGYVKAKYRIFRLMSQVKFLALKMMVFPDYYLLVPVQEMN